MLECVPNVSEGRDRSALDALAVACGASLLDVHSDPDHHRSVFTLAGPGSHDAEDAVRRLAAAVATHVTLVGHTGVHPRLGALDVVPFVALAGTHAGREEAARAAQRFARWWAERCDVPVFLYDEADPQRRGLPSTRREAFGSRPPDRGPPRPHPFLGTTAVGARRPLAAVNCDLATGDLAIGRRVAGQVREAGGGLRGVRALAFLLPSSGRVQVSLNLVDLDATGMEEACTRVRDLARAEGTDVVEVEQVGLVPAAALGRCGAEFLRWSALDPGATIESRLGARPPRTGDPGRPERS